MFLKGDITMAEALSGWLSSIGCPPFFAVFIISLLPILELRGGLIVAAILKLHWIPSFIVCYIGNILPVPFILLFIKKIFEWMKLFKPTKKIAEFFENKAHKHIEKSKEKQAERDAKLEAKNKKPKSKLAKAFSNYIAEAGIGRLLFVFWFVAIPLPGTGAWTGALIASFMNMKLKHSIPTILLGVLSAGIIMLTLCFVFPEIFSKIFGFSF